MDKKLKKELKKLSKNEASFNTLKKLFQHEKAAKNKYKKNLDLLERVIENDYDSILITELDLEKPGPKIVYVNEGFTKLTGYKKDEVIGKTPRILQGPKTERKVLDQLKKNLKNGHSFFGKTVNYRKDGSEFVNQWDIHPLTDNDGNITHWVSYQHDITKRKRAERTLVDAKAEFDNLREMSNATLVDVDAEGNIVTANKAFRKLSGYTKDELIGIKIWELFPRKYRSSLKSRFTDPKEDSPFHQKQFQGIINHKNGFPIQIEGTTKVMDLKKGTIIRGIIKNISLQKRILKALEKRNKDYGNIVERASEFTYRLAVKGEKFIVDQVSDDFFAITGASKEILDEPFEIPSWVHPKDAKKVKSFLDEVRQGNTATCEYRIHTAQENSVDIIDYAEPIINDKDESVQYIKGSVSLKTDHDMIVEME